MLADVFFSSFYGYYAYVVPLSGASEGIVILWRKFLYVYFCAHFYPSSLWLYIGPTG